MISEGFRSLSEKAGKVASRSQAKPSSAVVPPIDANAYFEHLAGQRSRFDAKSQSPHVSPSLPEWHWTADKEKPPVNPNPLLITRHEMKYKPAETPQANMGRELVDTFGTVLFGKSSEELGGINGRLLGNLITRTFTEPLIKNSEARQSTVYEGRMLTETPFGHVVTKRHSRLEADEDHSPEGKMVTRTTYWVFPRGEQHPVDVSWGAQPTLVVQGVVKNTHYNVTLAAPEADDPKTFTFTR